jgi:AbrB family looped-hinge helix DNA binding protein
MIQVVLDQAGKVEIPAEIRQKLNLNAGAKLLIDSTDSGEITMTLSSEEPELIQVDGVWVVNTEIEEDVARNWLEIVNQNRERRIYGF